MNKGAIILLAAGLVGLGYVARGTADMAAPANTPAAAVAPPAAPETPGAAVSAPAAPSPLAAPVMPAPPVYATRIEAIEPQQSFCTGPAKKHRNWLWGGISFIPRRVGRAFRDRHDAETDGMPAWRQDMLRGDDQVDLCVAVDGDGIVRTVHGIAGRAELWAPAADAARQWQAMADPRRKSGQLSWARMTVSVKRDGSGS